MTFKAMITVVGLTLAAASVSAAASGQGELSTAPPAEPGARICLRLEAITGTRLEVVRCWTRQEWAEQGVDVDKEWPKEGVAVRR